MTTQTILRHPDRLWYSETRKRPIPIESMDEQYINHCIQMINRGYGLFGRTVGEAERVERHDG